MTLSQETRTALNEALSELSLNRSNEAAWSRLYRGLWAHAFAHAYGELKGMGSAAEDVAQSAFVKLYLDITFPNRVHSVDHLINLLRQMVARACIDLWRTELRDAPVDFSQVRAEAAPMLEAPDRADKWVEWVELAHVLEDEIGQLDDDDRRLLELTLRGEPRAAMALELNRPYSSVVVRLHRLRHRLRKALVSRHLVDEPRG